MASITFSTPEAKTNSQIMDLIMKLSDRLDAVKKWEKRTTKGTFGSHPSQRLFLKQSKPLAQQRLVNSPANKTHPEIYRILLKIMELKDPDFNYTCIQVNKNSKCIPHKDNNLSVSYGFSCGDFECEHGGDLVIYPDAEDKDYLGEPQYIDYEMAPTKFDANNVFHTTNPTITGERYSILYYTHKAAREEDFDVSEEFTMVSNTVQHFSTFKKYMEGMDLSPDHIAKCLCVELLKLKKEEMSRWSRLTDEERKILEDTYVRPGLKGMEYLENEPSLKDDILEAIKKNKLAEKHGQDTIDELTNQLGNVKLSPKKNVSKTLLKKINHTRCATYVINLKHRPERLKCMLENLSNSNFARIYVVEAVDGQTLEDKFTKRGKLDSTKFRSARKTLSKQLGQIGCALSHLQVLEEAIEKGLNKLIIMEDDIDFDHQLFTRPWTFIPKDAEVVVFGMMCNGSSPSNPTLKMADVYKNQSGAYCEFVEGEYIWMTHCYMLTSAEAIKKFYDLYNPFYPGRLKKNDMFYKKLSRINHAYDCILTKAIYPEMKTYFLKNPVKQNGSLSDIEGTFERNTVAEQSVDAVDAEEKQVNNDDETKSDDDNRKVSASESEEEEEEDDDFIYLAYLAAKDTYGGGWKSFAIHLHWLLGIDNFTQVISVVPTTTRKTDKDFGYKVTLKAMDIDTLAKKKNVMVVCCSGKQNHEHLKKLKGKYIVVHDENEVKGKDNKIKQTLIKDMKVIVIRESFQQCLKEKYGIDSQFIHHPFYQFANPKHHNLPGNVSEYKKISNKKRDTIVSTARLANRKQSNIILDANKKYFALEGVNVRKPLIEMYGMDDDRIVADWKKKYGEVYDKSYQGTYDFQFIEHAKIYSEALAVVDLSCFDNEGGGTQYTFLEAIHMGCLLILHKRWFENKKGDKKFKSQFKHKVNCYVIETAEELMELCDDIKTAGAVKKAKHQKMIEKAQEILPQHENKSEWIKLFVEEKKKAPLRIKKTTLRDVGVRRSPRKAISTIAKLFDKKPDFKEFTGKGSNWFAPTGANGKGLLELVKRDDINVVLELGSWYGSGSAKFMCENTNNLDAFKLYCVDFWDGERILDKNVRENIHSKEAIRNVKKHPLYETFIVNLWQYQENVYPLKMSSQQGLEKVYNTGIKPDMIWIDASHYYEDVKEDIEKSLQLFPDALLCGDDYTQHDGVKKAVDEIAERENFEVFTFKKGPFWRYDKK